MKNVKNILDACKRNTRRSKGLFTIFYKLTASASSDHSLATWILDADRSLHRIVSISCSWFHSRTFSTEALILVQHESNERDSLGGKTVGLGYIQINIHLYSKFFILETEHSEGNSLGFDSAFLRLVLNHNIQPPLYFKKCIHDTFIMSSNHW